jgi:hypothetical protein
VAVLQLFVPELVPAPADSALPHRFPALHRWLARARLSRTAADGLDQALCQCFGVARQRDWPVAPLTLLADGEAPGVAWWLRADPVTVQPTRAGLVLAGSCATDLARAEADALLAALNQYFAAEGLRFLAPTPERWYVQIETPAAIDTTPLRDALGSSVAAVLPRGPDALAWHRRLNEIQMLLHEHPVNAAREARAAAPVNSLWFWGGGRLPVCAADRVLTVWADTALARGLAACARVACQPLPRDARAWLREAVGGGEHLLVLGEAAGAPALAQRWDELERLWIEPLTAALYAGALQRAALVTASRGALLRFELSPRDRWKFWRRTLPAPARLAPADA